MYLRGEIDHQESSAQCGADDMSLITFRPFMVIMKLVSYFVFFPVYVLSMMT